MSDDEEAYLKVKQIQSVCRSAASRLWAEEELKKMGLWYEWVRDFPPFVKIHGG